jgi:hypothetical protein
MIVYKDIQYLRSNFLITSVIMSGANANHLVIIRVRLGGSCAVRKLNRSLFKELFQVIPSYINIGLHIAIILTF